jgi:flagellar motility protein MotE (MotC chaperone)
MDPVRGGGILSGMAANKQLDDVAKILFYMSERTSAKMLAEITDKVVAAQLTEKMQKIREEG